MESSAPARPPPPPPPPLEVPSTSYGALAAATTSTSYGAVGATLTSTSNAISSKPAETAFRILCPASKTNRLADIPGIRIRILDEFPVASSHDERVVLVSSIPREDASSSVQANNSDGNFHLVTSSSLNTEDFPAYQALVRVFERIVSLDEEDKEKESSASGERTVVFRLLVDSSRIGVWKEGGLLEKMMQESGASVKLQPKDQFQATHDELIEIVGNFSTVEKALKSLSSCPMDAYGVDCTNLVRPGLYGVPHSASDAAAQVDPFPPRNHPLGRHHADFQRGNHPHPPGPENFGPNRRMGGEAEIVFKLLCHQEKVGSLIGKGGSVIRSLENDTGTYIKIVEGLSDTDERVVSISARENAEQKVSPAQDAVMRVQYRIAEIGFEPGSAVVARLYVPSHQVRYLLGKGGCIINEMRRATPCSIRVFPRDQAPKFANHNDEVVQVVGNLQAVQDTLFQITSRIREVMFPIRPSHNTSHAPAPGPYMPPYSEMGLPHARPRHNPHSPGPYPPPQGPVPHGFDGSGPPRPFDPQPSFPRGMEHNVPPNAERVPPYHYGGEQQQGYGPPPPPFDRLPSPRMFAPLQHQPFSGGNPRGGPDFGPRPPGSDNQGPIMTTSTVEVVIPQSVLGHVHGENSINLVDIRQISRAKVDVYGPKPGATEGVVVVVGTPDQVHAAQSLIHAFIFCGQAF